MFQLKNYQINTNLLKTMRGPIIAIIAVVLKLLLVLLLLLIEHLVLIKRHERNAVKIDAGLIRGTKAGLLKIKGHPPRLAVRRRAIKLQVGLVA